MAWEKSIFLGDSHGDHVSEEAVRIARRFIDDWKPKYRVHLGDVWDFGAFRKNADAEDKAKGITRDYDCGMEFLDWYKPTHLLLGNHDFRLWRVASERRNGPLADLCALKAKETEKNLDKRGIQWKPYKVTEYLQLPAGGPKLIHGFRSTASPAKAHFDNWGSCVCGHVHKPDRYEARHIDGGKAFTVGCMADIDKMEYADHTPAKLAWRNSFLYGIHNTKTGAWDAWEVIRKGNEWISPQGVLT